jgi:lipopolysaccharide biosynthesis glycosyltransferase
MTHELHTLPALQHVKVRITELFPQLWDRLVYLDCDITVQVTGHLCAFSLLFGTQNHLITSGWLDTGDIWELFSTDIQPGHFAAFSQSCVGTLQKRKAHYGAFTNLRQSSLNASDMGHEACPFATWVFVANLTLWRWHRVADKLQHWLMVHRR